MEGWAGGRCAEGKGVLATTADVVDRVGEALSECDACSLCDRRGVDGCSAVSVRVPRARGEGNAGGFLGLEGRDWAGVEPASAA